MILSNKFKIKKTKKNIHNNIIEISGIHIKNAKYNKKYIYIIDICCGSGKIGKNFTNKKLTNVYFLEKNNKNIKYTKVNMNNLIKNKNIKYINKEMKRINQYKIKFNIIFIDFPYKSYTNNNMIIKIKSILLKNTIIIIETCDIINYQYIRNYDIIYIYKHNKTLLFYIKI